MWKERRRRLAGVENSRKLVKLAKFGFLAIIVGFLGLFIVLPLFAFNLPTPDKIVRREGFSTKILDRNGQVLYDIYSDQRRTPVEITNVPLYLKQATVAIEDKNFYKHQGFDPLGMLRGFSRLFTRGYAQGGSTLTQQLVKNVLLTSERSVFRKINEFILAVQIERRYSKDQILQMYLNEAPYGGTAWGVEAASEVYFGKSVKDLNLVESAILAGMPQRPSAYSPYSSTPKAYIERTKAVLRRMREDGYITSEQEEASLAELENVKFQSRGSSFKAPHFVQYVQKILEERYGEKVVEQGGLKVTTTLDLSLQEKAQNIVSEEIAKVENLRITNGGSVVIDPQTAQILAMVGSKKFDDPNYDGQVNVTVALRQPGSSFKPITYVTAFKKGYTPSTMLVDVPTSFPGGEGQPDYNPVSYDGKYRGPVQLRYALGNSLNIPAVKLLALVGIKDVLQTAYDLGLTSLPPTNETLSRVGLSLTLGGGEIRLLELTSAYSAFFNGGYKVEPVAILKVEDADGKVLEEVKTKKSASELGTKQVLTKEQAFLISHVLSDNEARKDAFGPNSSLNVSGKQIAAKTGTTNDKRDNWTIGGNPQRAVGVWVGNNDNTPMLSLTSGVSGAAPIWRKILLESLNGLPSVNFEAPEGIETASVDMVSGYREHDGFPARSELFIKGSVPSGDDPMHLKLKLCRNENKLANPSDVAANNYDEKEFFVFKEDFHPKWQEGINTWLSGQADQRYHPPTEYCGTSNPINVEFKTPRDRDRIDANDFDIKISPISSSQITRVELYIDGTNIRNFDGPPYEHHAVSVADGVHTIRAVAKDSNGKESDRVITIGVNVPWDSSQEESN